MDSNPNEHEEKAVDTEILIAEWDRKVARLREYSDWARWMVTRVEELSLYEDPGHLVKEFRRLADRTRREELESLILETVTLHNRAAGVLNPDTGPKPVPTPFVRVMPPDQADIEARRSQTVVRHANAYVAHIAQAMAHFALAWTALIDGCQVCDWEMIDDEFPKLAQLVEEAARAYSIWSSIVGPS